MKKITSLANLEWFIEHKIDLYDSQGNKIDIIRLMYNRLYDTYMDIKNEKLFYDEIDLIG